MRKVEISGYAALDRIMGVFQAIHQPTVVSMGDDTSAPTFLIYYEPHTNHRLEDWGEVWDENGGFVR